MLKITASGLKDLAQVLDTPPELALERVADDVAFLIHGGLSRNEEQLANLNAGAEGQVRGGRAGVLRIADKGMVHARSRG